jgi:hypothetical protein
VKKLIGLLSILFLMGLYACSPQKEDSPSVTESPNPLDVYFEHIQTMNQYRMDIEITANQVTYLIQIKRNVHDMSYSVDGYTEYYTKLENRCYVYQPYSDGYQKNSVDCSQNDLFSDMFFRSLTREMFTEINGRYYMGLQYLNLVESFFKSAISTSKVSNFEILFGQEFIEGFLFDVTIAQVIYHHKITFYDINSTIILFPIINQEAKE